MTDCDPMLRVATVDDADRIHDLHIASVRALCVTHYAPAVIDGWLWNRSGDGYVPAIERGEMFVADLGDRLAGFGHAVRGEVVAVFVAPEFAGKGVGRRIAERAVALARDGCDGPVRLEATLNAAPFYEKLGFREVGRTALRRGAVDVPVVEMLRDA